MPYLDRPDARLFYDWTPAQRVDPRRVIITTHGFMENGSYWGLTGVSDRLARAGWSVADLDLRGHGRSVPVGTSPAYTIEAVVDDIKALTNELRAIGIVLLTHATGGMAGLRYAMGRQPGLLGIIATDCSSATLPTDDYCSEQWDRIPFTAERISGAGSGMAEMLDAGGNARSLLEQLRKAPDDHMLSPFFRGFDSCSDPARAWQWVEDIYASNNWRHCAAFARQFFDDLNPQAEGLRSISCPTLVIVGEADVLLRAPCAMIARCVPDARLEVMPGRGHMTAIEDPDGLVALLTDFLTSIDRPGGRTQ